ncbi:MAG: hypothetical protein HY855_01685 [Burkholderiales bacterium]|nr:hypothetical protein [Burkholderiales bacterium]
MRPLLLLGAALLLAGCAGAPRTPAQAPGSAAAPAAQAGPGQAPHARGEPRAAAPAASAPGPRPQPLAGEQRWLSQLFEGTPVRIDVEPDGAALLLRVPMAHSFETDSPQPKPALAAVLDKLSQSLKRQPASKLQIGAPGPAARALAARRHLLSRGVAAHRVEAASAAGGDGVVLRLSLTPVAAARIGEAGVPMSARPVQSH